MTPLDKIIAVRSIKNLPHAQKVILLVIATHLGNNSIAYPGLTTLQKECGMSRTAISENISKLIKTNLLIKLPPNDGHRSNSYSINFDVINQSARTTRLVVQNYPKGNIKEIKRKIKTTQTKKLSHEKNENCEKKNGERKNKISETKHIRNFIAGS